MAAGFCHQHHQAAAVVKVKDVTIVVTGSLLIGPIDDVL